MIGVVKSMFGLKFYIKSIFSVWDIMYRVVKKKIMKVSFFQYILDPLKNILTKIHDFPAFRYPVTGPKRCEKSPFLCCSVALNSPLRTIFGPFYDFSVFSESRWVSTKDRFISIAFFYLVVEESFWRSLKSEAPSTIRQNKAIYMIRTLVLTHFD